MSTNGVSENVRQDAIGPGAASRHISHVVEDEGERREEDLIDHLTEVSQMAGEFADAFGARELAEQIGLAHDIGKYSNEFQNRILRGGGKVDHSTAGAYELLQKGSWQGAYCVAGHHSGLLDGGTNTDNEDAGTLCARMKKAASGKIPDYSSFSSEVDLAQFNQGQFPLTYQPDWGWPECCFSNSFFTRMLFSCLVDADFLCTERFMQGREREGLHYDSLETLRGRFEEHIAQFYPPKGRLNELRCGVLDDCLRVADQRPGVFTLTVPTGGGKTLASMRFALNHALRDGNEMRRVIYAIPYTSIIEQNAAVFRGIFGYENVLEHHANFDFDSANDAPGNYASSSRGERLRLATENWDAPIVVTTNVQLFESLFAAKTSRCRKLHNIARSVIVLDEVQMIPTEEIKPCIRALVELVVNYGCTVVLCTATQPAFNGYFEELGLDVKEITSDPEGLARELERASYEFEGQLSDEELADRLATEPRVLCIVNNRAQAKRIYESLDNRGVEGIYHLSTFMHPEHRRRVLEEIRDRLFDPDASCRVVSTSLVEAGVDLDFPVVYRAYAGVDSIDQAGGRCNREGKLGRAGGKVHVFETEAGVNAPSDVKNRAGVTREVVRETLGNDFSRIGSLEAVEAYFKKLFWLRSQDLDEHRTVEKLSAPSVIKGSGKHAFADFLSYPFKTVADSFRMIEEGASTVIIPDASVSREIEALERGYATRRDMRRLSRYSVGVYKDALRRLEGCGAVETVEGADDLYLLLDKGRYSESTGLDTSRDGGVGMLWL